MVSVGTATGRSGGADQNRYPAESRRTFVHIQCVLTQADVIEIHREIATTVWGADKEE